MKRLLAFLFAFLLLLQIGCSGKGFDGGSSSSTPDHSVGSGSSAADSSSADEGTQIPPDTSDPERDLETLRHNADFETKILTGIYWVPARALGESDYTNAQIRDLLCDTPEEKQAKIDTLYEALQLYQIGVFATDDDNIRIQEGRISWEHHKPGYHAVRTNAGCCATNSNWLRYILDGDYDEVGYVAYSERDGSGHIFNYIKQDGWYYMIDLTHYRMDFLETAVESGEAKDYFKTDFIAGNIHKVEDIQRFVNYIQNTFNEPPGLIFMYTAENCLALDGVPDGDVITIIYEDREDVSVDVIFDDPTDQLEYTFTSPPKKHPDWAALPDFDFTQIP